MLANSQLLNSSNEKNSITYVAIPLDSLKNPGEYGDLKVIQNIVLKQLADGSICLVEDEEKQNVSDKQSPLTFSTTTSNVNTDTSRRTLSRKRTIILQHPLKKPNQDRSPLESKPQKKLLSKILDQKYKCIKCDILFESLQLYRDHMKWHRCQKKFKCPKCYTGYNIENNLKIHMVLMHSEENNAQCPICDVNLTFQRAASLRSHLILHQVEEFYTCDECSGEFDKDDDFIKHMLTHSTKKKYKITPLTCSYCKVKFQDIKELRAHVSDHVKLKKTFTKPKRPRKPGSKKDTNHVCTVCNKSFIKHSLLERHERIHSGEKPYKCEFCDRGFTQKGTLQIHLSRHTGIKPFSCTLCPAKFNQKGNLRVHIQKTHTFPNEGQKMYKCSQCTCIFKKIATLNGHVTKAHLNNKDSPEMHDNLIDEVMLKLKELQKQTSSNPSELENTDKNKENEPKEGVIVENNLKGISDVQTPNFVHLSESVNDGTVRKYFVRQKKIGDTRWYFCNYCSKQFKKPSDLMRHIRVHTKEKPFKCKQCKTAFSLKSTLISHMRTHKNKLDYKCKICNSSFVSLRILNAHLRKHDFDSLPKWQCVTCGYLFDELEKGYKHREEKGREKAHVIQPFIHNILKQPLYQTTYGSLSFKTPKTRFPNTGTESPITRPFHCTICDARFTRRINLKRHIQYHNGERKFECHMCPKTFITSYRLKEHLNYHNNIKNHGCTVCGKRFVTATLLKRHLIIHNTFKPYQCPYCTKTFKTLLLCRTHINKVHKKDVVPKFVTESNEPILETFIDSNNVQFTTELVPDQSSNNTINTLQEVQENNGSEELPVNSENLDIPRFFTAPSNSIQIIDTNVGDQDPNNFQTLYVDMDDLPFLNNSNLNLNSSLQTQLKLQSADSLLINPMNDLQDSIIFNIDSLKPELDLPPDEIFNNENIDVSTASTTLPSIAEISTKTIKLNSFSDKNLSEKDGLNELLDTNSGLYSNVTFAEGLSLPIGLSDGSNVFNSNTPTTIFQPTMSADLNNTADIYESTNIMCITCSRLFITLEDFQNHPCDLLTDFDVATEVVTADVTTDVATADVVTADVVTTDVVTADVVTADVITADVVTADVVTAEAVAAEEPILNNEEISDSSINLEAEETIKEVFECHICKKILANKFSHYRHVMSHETKPTYECGVCQKVIQGRNVYVKHLATHTGTSGSLLRTCKYCFKDFKKPSDLKRHLRTHTGEKPFGCHLCDKKFSLKSTLESHIKTHDPNPKQFVCDICNSFFSSKSSLKVHTTIHTGQRTQSCSFCNQKFRTAGNRKTHEILMHLSKSRKRGASKRTKITNMLETIASEDINKLNDTQLDNTISVNTSGITSTRDGSNTNSEVLSSHIINLSENLLPNLPEDQIPIDPVMLLQQLQMSGMILTNDNNEPVSSLILDDVTLLDVGNVKDNISLPPVQSNVPVSENIFVKSDRPKTLECDICHKMYASRQILRKHRTKIHGVNKKYPCIKCDNGFNTQDELNRHIKLHAGYRPFSCLYCANSFTEEHSLKTHIKRIHERSNETKETASALLNMRFDFLPSNIEEPLFNNLFTLKKSV